MEEPAPERRVALSLFLEDEAAARALAEAEQGTVARAVTEGALDYQDEWEPLRVGSRFLLHPPWIAPDVEPSRIPLVMQPGAVFGSGDHATTQLCLELLEGAVTPLDTVLDVGTGTGILAIAAKRLGAASVIAFDIDATAVGMAKEAAREARAAVSLWQGSWHSCRPRCASGVCVNLPGAMLLEVLPELAALLRRGGWMVLSGILAEQRDATVARCEALGLASEKELARDGWSAFRLRL